MVGLARSGLMSLTIGLIERLF
uniref:Uncharacterized protein n=1 Tax=Arundo donax TaxID=35708 RepID=A0A0A9BPA0_ARUDO